MRASVSTLLLIASLCVTGAARADVPPPDSCFDAVLGADCALPDGGTGSCQRAACGAGSEPCLRCLEASPALDAATESDAAPAAAPGSSGGAFGCAFGRSGSLVGALAFAAALPVLVRRRRR